MLALLADIGSTFTKVVVADVEAEKIVCTAQAATTREEDVTIGLQEALRAVKEHIPLRESQIAYKLACSSAAGGLRMVTVGLIPELTVEAAKRAALGAGAKVVGVFSHQLTEQDLAAIDELRPDILLLTGGTDGGNEKVILHNAEAIAASPTWAPVVVAGNRAVAHRVADILRSRGLEVWVTENVMPEIDQLDIRPAQEAIRQIFLKRIVEAKGLKKAESFFSRVLMPTPSAVLEAARLLAEGIEEEEGWGDLIVVDVGGATTDVHSIGYGKPTTSRVLPKGLPEPFAKRTVEGDMGIRYNAPTILEIAGRRKLCQAIGRDEPDLETIIDDLSRNVSRLPQNEAEAQMDIGLARTAVEIAVDRHVGTLRFIYTSSGELALQYGKDLTEVSYLIGTGGIFAHSSQPRRVLEGALFDSKNPTSLRPKDPQMVIDGKYIIPAMGLLANKRPTIALRMLKRNLQPL